MDERTHREAESNYALGKALLSDMNNAIASGNSTAAAAALASLKSIPIISNTPAGALLSAIVSMGASAQNTINQIAAEEDNDVTVSASAPSVFSGRGVQRLIMSKMSPEVREFFEKELKTDRQREAFTDVAAHSLHGEECDRCRRELGLGDKMDDREEGRLRMSLDELKQFKIDRIRNGPGTEEEKNERIERLEQRFKEAEERLRATREAERRETAAEERAENARRRGASPEERAEAERRRAERRAERLRRRDELAGSLGVVRDSVAAPERAPDRAEGLDTPDRAPNRAEGRENGRAPNRAVGRDNGRAPNRADGDDTPDRAPNRKAEQQGVDVNEAAPLPPPLPTPNGRGAAPATGLGARGSR
ncbi:MAG: hypothetical protein K2Q01_07925 [Rickettsiales bacterium]|nr:hypothetical protein [Rickettsiales bacterium]